MLQTVSSYCPKLGHLLPPLAHSLLGRIPCPFPGVVAPSCHFTSHSLWRATMHAACPTNAQNTPPTTNIVSENGIRASHSLVAMVGLVRRSRALASPRYPRLTPTASHTDFISTVHTQHMTASHQNSAMLLERAYPLISLLRPSPGAMGFYRRHAAMLALLEHGWPRPKPESRRFALSHSHSLLASPRCPWPMPLALHEGTSSPLDTS